MYSGSDLQTKLQETAKRAVALKSACNNEESTKLYLVLPFLGALGYDYTNPYEVYPEHAADFDVEYPDKVDIAILRDGIPSIAIEVKKAGTPIDLHRGQLARYFNALPSVKLGIITDGLVYAFYVDSDAPNIMDDDPFLVLDLERIASSNIDVEALDAVSALTKPLFQPQLVAQKAQDKLLKHRLKSWFLEEARSPSQEFCRLALERVGLKNVRSSTIQRHYAPIVLSAFEESLVVPVVSALRSAKDYQQTHQGAAESIEPRIVTTDRELSVYNFVRRRLSFLVKNESYFDAIERIQYRDYIGHFAVYYEQVKKGRLFDFIEGADGYDRYIFPDQIGVIITSNLRDLDKPLLSIFVDRVQQLGTRDASSSSTATKANRAG